MMDSVFLNAYLTSVMIFQEPQQSYFRWHHSKVPSYLATTSRRETRMVTIPRVQVLPHARHGRTEQPNLQ
jgi:hypothetical protein